MKDIEQTIFWALLIVGVASIAVIGIEQSRKVDQLTSQIREMRQSMEDAGYVPREPKIGVER